MLSAQSLEKGKVVQIGRRDFLKTGTLLMLGGCAPLWLSSPAGASPDSHFDWALAPPEALGMSRAGIEGIRAEMQKNIDARVIAGAVTAVARRDKLVWLEAQGLADVETGEPMHTDSIFRMMSSTKPVVTVAVLMMMEEGKLSLDDPVSRFIPSFRNQRVAISPPGNTDPKKVTFVPAERDITIRDLLTHTAGLMSVGSGLSAGPGFLVNKVDRSPSSSTLADVVPQIGSFALDFQPGSRWAYSPLEGFDTLLHIVERVSGVPADRFLAARIFEPLGMRSTGFNVPASDQERIVQIYRAKDGGFEPKASIFGEGPFTYFSGAGGLFSTAHDYMNFYIMLLNRGSFNGRRVLQPETVAMMSHNQVGTLFADWLPLFTDGYGFGLSVKVLEDESKGHGRSVGAFGWDGALGTEAWADPELDLAAVMMIQMDPAPVNLKNDFARAIRAAIIA